jgi:hypothetical protein
VAWVLGGALAASSRYECERSLTLEERLLLVIQRGTLGGPTVDLLKYQQYECSKALNRQVRGEHDRWER